MEINQLRNFVSIAHCLSMTSAAKELGVSQPSLSQSLKKLEEELGVSLFDRKGRRLRLNSYGSLFLSQVETVFRAMENAELEIKDSSNSGTRRIRLVARQPMGDTATIIGNFLTTHPDILISCVTPNESTFASDYDLELFASQDNLKANNVIQLCTEDFVLCVPKTHRLSQRSEIKLRNLSKEKFVLSPAKSEMNSIISSMFSEAGFQPRCSAYVSLYRDVISLVERDKGICLAAEKTWFAGMEPNLKILHLSDVTRSRNVYLRWPDKAYLSSSSIAFIDYLRTVFE